MIFLRQLFDCCDFMMLQEHGLYKSQFGWFDKLGDNVCKHGASAMDETKILKGRPNGGVAIVWKSSIKAKVSIVDFESDRVCAINVNLNGTSTLIICVYMPCDDNRPNHNMVEYNKVLSDIKLICDSSDAQQVILAGDFNTDLGRNSYCTHALNEYVSEENMYFSVSAPCNTVQFTYQSKGSGRRSLIDHFIISDNIKQYLSYYSPCDGPDNFSDHLAVKCVLDIQTTHIVHKPSNQVTEPTPAWHNASEVEIGQYKCVLDDLLKNICIPLDAVLCTDKMCKIHFKDICDYHNNIIYSMIDACNKCIPFSRSKGNSKVVPGWNDHVKGYFEASLFWHNMWVENGKPHHGVIAELRRRTRAKYHLAYKMAIKKDAEIRCNKMAQALSAKDNSSFWKQVKSFRQNKSSFPVKVDYAEGEEEISDLFADKFYNLYNSVSYDSVEMNQLKCDIDNMIIEQCCTAGQCTHGNHGITAADVQSAVHKLKHGKKDGNSNVVSDNIIYAGHRLHVHLAILFTAMLRHGITPEGMLNGTMVPIPKGRWANLSSSDNFRAITLSSVLCKLVDVIVLNKEEKRMCTSDLQFGFKSGSSTSMCTAMIQETIAYYVNNGSNVYGLMLDASKAFDRVNYCKLFRILIDRNVCPLYCRLLLNMYVNQKLRVRWNNTHSPYFNVTNGVKQGGVISPILFCIYMDGLLNELANSEVGCYMGGVFAGGFGYADDLKLLTPSVQGLRIMADICEKYADKYNIMFNGKKSELIIYRCSQSRPPDPGIFINDVRVPRKEKVTHLGHDLYENVFQFGAAKCIKDFNSQCNSFFCDFKNASSHMRNELFSKYCMSFYGSQILPLFNTCMESVYTAWRVAMRKVWRLPWLTHCNLLPHISGNIGIELWFAKRCIKFLEMAYNSDNAVVRTIARMSDYGTYSIMGGNRRYLQCHYDMNVHNIYKHWKCLCENEDNIIRISSQVKELCEWRDSCAIDSPLNQGDCKYIIDFLCTS